MIRCLPLLARLSRAGRTVCHVAWSKRGMRAASCGWRRVHSAPAWLSAAGVHTDIDTDTHTDVVNRAEFRVLASTLEQLEETSGRLDMLEVLRLYFQQVNDIDPTSLPVHVGLTLGQVAPVFKGVRFGVGDVMLLKAAADLCGQDVDVLRGWMRGSGAGMDEVWTRFVEARDNTSHANQEQPPISVVEVAAELIGIAEESGAGSVARRQQRIQDLWLRCGSPTERKYLLRILQGRLRVGVQEKSVLSAVVDAVCPSVSAESKERVQDLFMQHSNLFDVVATLQNSGVEGVATGCPMSPGVPAQSMLAVAASDCHEIAERLCGGPFTLEYKLDGERVQLHGRIATDGAEEYSVFSRRTENVTEKYLDVAQFVGASANSGVHSFVMDAEAVAMDSQGAILPFQTLTTRKRKNKVDGAKSIDANSASWGVCAYAFDLLLLNDEVLVDKPLEERRELTRQHFREVPGQLQFVPHVDMEATVDGGDCSDCDELAASIQGVAETAVHWGAEGIMAKALQGPASVYRCGSRTKAWMKLKKDFVGQLGGDSLDLVPIAAYMGKGSRRGVYGSFVMACIDSDTSQLVSVCKLGTGFSDEQLVQATESLAVVAQAGATTPELYAHIQVSPPDVWFEPSQVWEVQASDLSLSPVHTAGEAFVRDATTSDDASRHVGIGLRFPRFIRTRPDKAVNDATTSQVVVDMYKSQLA